MRLTKKKAIEITIELWTWLAETGNGHKGKWIGWKEYGVMESDCPLCEYDTQRDYANEAISPIMCNFCPYRKKFGDCLDRDSTFLMWCKAKRKGQNTRKVHAAEFLEQLKQL